MIAAIERSGRMIWLMALLTGATLVFLSCRSYRSYQANLHQADPIAGSGEDALYERGCQGDECRFAWGSTAIVMKERLGPDVIFMQTSRSNDDVRGGDNPEELLRARVGSERELRRITQMDYYEQFIYRAQLLSHTAALDAVDPGIYEVYTITMAVEEVDASKRNYRFAAFLESTSPALAEAAVQGKFRIAGRAGGTTVPYKPFSISSVKDLRNTVSESISDTITLPRKGRFEAVVGIDNDTQRWIQCRIQFQVPLDASTQILCERFKFPPLARIRSNSATTLDTFRFKAAPEGLGSNCISLEQVGENGGDLTADSKLAYVFREVQSAGRAACISCHLPDNELSLPTLFCPKTGDDDFDPLGRPREIVEVMRPIAAYFQSLEKGDDVAVAATTVPKYDNREIWDGSFGDDENAWQVMANHFQALVDAYCKQQVVTYRNREGMVQTSSVRKILDENFNNFLGSFQPPQSINGDAICN